MYFPLLRGKQYELVALKEFAEAHPANPWLCPIIEPVRVLSDALVRAAEVLSRNGFRYSVVLNPATMLLRPIALKWLLSFKSLMVLPLNLFLHSSQMGKVE